MWIQAPGHPRRDPGRNSASDPGFHVPKGGMATHLVAKRCDLGSLGVPGPASTPCGRRAKIARMPWPRPWALVPPSRGIAILGGWVDTSGVRVGATARRRPQGVLAGPGTPRDPKSHLFATKWVAIPQSGTWDPGPDAEFRPGSRRGDPGA